MIDEDTSWQKQLLVGAGLLLVVGLMVGGVVGLAALKAADVAGVGETPAPETGPPPGLGPTATSPETPDQEPDDTGSTSSTRTPTETPTRTPTPSTPTFTPPPPQSAIALAATPLRATSYQRVSLTGTSDAVPGTSLQVQRNRGGVWANFPTTASVDGGTFSTYVATGLLGRNPFRVVDTSTGKTSNVVVVMITG